MDPIVWLIIMEMEAWFSIGPDWILTLNFYFFPLEKWRLLYCQGLWLGTVLEMATALSSQNITMIYWDCFKRFCITDYSWVNKVTSLSKFVAVESRVQEENALSTLINVHFLHGSARNNLKREREREKRADLGRNAELWITFTTAFSFFVNSL